MSEHSVHRIIVTTLVISGLLLGISILLLGHHKHISLATDFFGLSKALPNELANTLAAAAFILMAVLSAVTIKRPEIKIWLGYLLIAIATVPLLSLFADSMWIESLGGFPAIGSGQGVIKYFALLAIGLSLLPQLSHTSDRGASLRVWLNLFPVLLVLLWIGGMKFTLLEAQGIEPLVASSPLMSWMYSVWDLQTTSNLIGVYDLLAIVLLMACVFIPKLRLPAFAMAGAVFVVTQTFLLSFTPSLSAQTLLSTTGHFLIKDLWYIANLALAWQALTLNKHQGKQQD